MTSTDTQPSQQIIRSRSGPIGFVRSLARLLSGKPNVPPSLADNPLLETILQRRSVRTFDKREIPDDVFAAILEAARVAPSTVNLQSWSFAVFTAETWRATFDRPDSVSGSARRHRDGRHAPRSHGPRRLSAIAVDRVHPRRGECFAGRDEHEHRRRSAGRIVGHVVGDGTHGPAGCRLFEADPVPARLASFRS